LPLISKGEAFGSLNLASRRIDAFTEQEAELLGQVGRHGGDRGEERLGIQKIDALKRQVGRGKAVFRRGDTQRFNFEEIIGESPALRKRWDKWNLRAPANTTVLLRGEPAREKNYSREPFTI